MPVERTEMSDLTKYEKVLNLLNDAISAKEQAAEDSEDYQFSPREQEIAKFLSKMEVLEIAKLMLKIEQTENIEWVGSNV